MARLALACAASAALAGCLSGGSSGSDAAPASAEANAPAISGTPALAATVGASYTFAPVASDPDGDRLTFKAQNLPPWADFDPTTGRISGRPGDGDVGVYQDIVITVSDGAQSRTLPPFAIAVNQVGLASATVSWTPPTTRIDDTPVGDLAGYTIFYGSESENYSEYIVVDNPGVTRFVLLNLAPGRYYFAVSAFDTKGNTSDLSNEVSAQIG